MKEQPSAAMPETGLEIPLLSGATFPDWSVVTSENVRASLNATLGVLRMAKKWPGMGADEERVRVAVLTHYAEAGNAPSHGRLAEITGFEPDQIVRLLRKLEERDLVVLNKDNQDVIGAYPFTEGNTGHRIRLGGKTLNAMCAVDALGAGAMVSVDAVIDSTCRQCERAIHVETRDKGRGIQSVSPEGAYRLVGGSGDRRLRRRHPVHGDGILLFRRPPQCLAPRQPRGSRRAPACDG